MKHIELATRIRESANAVGDAVALKLRSREPDCGAGRGPEAEEHCRRDLRFHLGFLAGAVEAGEPELFEDYMRWVSRLPSRRIQRTNELWILFQRKS